MILYTVEKGDKLSSIAEKKLGDKNKADQIADLNNTSDAKLTVGQMLFVPASYYKTQAGDSLATMAKTQLGGESRKKEILLINELGGMCEIEAHPESDTWNIEKLLANSTPYSKIDPFEKIMQKTTTQLGKKSNGLTVGTVLLT